MAEDQREVGLRLLEKFDSKQASSVLHSLVDGLCRRCQVAYDKYSKTWTLEEWWALKDSYDSVFRQAVSETWTKDQTFQVLGSLSDELKQLVVDIVNSRREEIRHHLVSQTDSISQAVLKDFDWKLKLVMSSDKISSVQEPVLSLDLDVQKGQKNNITSLELNKEELHKLISSLENANKVVQQFKA